MYLSDIELHHTVYGVERANVTDIRFIGVSEKYTNRSVRYSLWYHQWKCPSVFPNKRYI